MYQIVLINYKCFCIWHILNRNLIFLKCYFPPSTKKHKYINICRCCCLNSISTLFDSYLTIKTALYLDIWTNLGIYMYIYACMLYVKIAWIVFEWHADGLQMRIHDQPNQHVTNITSTNNYKNVSVEQHLVAPATRLTSCWRHALLYFAFSLSRHTFVSEIWESIWWILSCSSVQVSCKVLTFSCSVSLSNPVR